MIPGRRQFDLFSYSDVVTARQCAREMARELGFGLTDQTRIATAVSEVAHQTVSNQGKGQVLFTTVMTSTRRGLECTCLSCEWLKTPSVPTSGDTLGGVARLMDEFTLERRGGDGVAVVMRKWLRPAV